MHTVGSEPAGCRCTYKKMRRSYLRAFVAIRDGERRREVCRYMLAVAGWRDRRSNVDDAVIAMAFTLRLNGNIETLHLPYSTTSTLRNYTAIESLLKL